MLLLIFFSLIIFVYVWAVSRPFFVHLSSTPFEYSSSFASPSRRLRPSIRASALPLFLAVVVILVVLALKTILFAKLGSPLFGDRCRVGTIGLFALEGAGPDSRQPFRKGRAGVVEGVGIINTDGFGVAELSAEFKLVCCVAVIEYRERIARGDIVPNCKQLGHKKVLPHGSLAAPNSILLEFTLCLE